MWSAYDKEHPERVRVLLIVVGLGLLVIAAFGMYRAVTRAHWPATQAQILTVETMCEMTASYVRRPRGERSGRTVVVGCDQVDQFLTEHRRNSWSVRWLYSGDVRILRNGNAVIVHMELRRSTLGLAPKIGDSFELLQNPDILSEVEFPDRSGMTALVAAGMGIIGVAVLVIVFWF